jgi:hypothetical protein
MDCLTPNNKQRVLREVDTSLNVELLNRNEPCAASCRIYTSPGTDYDIVTIVFKNEYQRDCCQVLKSDIFMEYKDFYSKRYPQIILGDLHAIELRSRFTEHSDFRNEDLDLRHFIYIEKK